MSQRDHSFRMARFDGWHLLGALAGGFAMGFVVASLTARGAPSREEMRSLIVASQFHDWSGAVGLRSYWSFGPYRCEDDCSGHAAGWEWAKRRGLNHAEGCDGEGNGSTSFYEGCLYYLEVRGVRRPAL